MLYVKGLPSISANELCNLNGKLKEVNAANDANNLKSGLYRVGETLPQNMPNADPNGLFVCIDVADNWLVQFYISLGVAIYKRSKINGNWNNWITQ